MTGGEVIIADEWLDFTRYSRLLKVAYVIFYESNSRVQVIV